MKNMEEMNSLLMHFTGPFSPERLFVVLCLLTSLDVFMEAALIFSTVSYVLIRFI